MPTVNVHQAKTRLSCLLAQAEAGEEALIARRGDPVVRLVPCKGKRRFGAMKGKIVVDDSILEPLPEEEIGALGRTGLKRCASYSIRTPYLSFDDYGVTRLW